MPFSPRCACCSKDIDDMNSVQVCEDCASKLEESAPSASTNNESVPSGRFLTKDDWPLKPSEGVMHRYLADKTAHVS